MFDQAIEAGAVDVDVGDDARILIFSEPHQTAATAAAMRASGHEIESSEIIWTPKVEVKVDTKSANTLASFIGMYPHRLSSSPLTSELTNSVRQAPR